MKRYDCCLLEHEGSLLLVVTGWKALHFKIKKL